jgi:lipoprotein-anchoring transpeptidase ErfK/SrfK
VAPVATPTTSHCRTYGQSRKTSARSGAHDTSAKPRFKLQRDQSDGKETIAGTYRVLRKHKKYISKTYGAEMSYSMFFTEDGKAIHGTQMAALCSYLHSYLTQSVGSHGCVGLTDDNALALFEWAPVGTPVIVMAEEKDR